MEVRLAERRVSSGMMEVRLAQQGVSSGTMEVMPAETTAAKPAALDFVPGAEELPGLLVQLELAGCEVFRSLPVVPGPTAIASPAGHLEPGVDTYLRAKAQVLD